jgi:hypothetical protein
MPPVQTVTNLDLIQTLEALDKFQQKIYDRASAYTRIIIGLAYAGFFTVWAGTSRYMGRRAVLWSALLMILSVMVYAIFEIMQMIIIGRFAIHFTRAIRGKPDRIQIELANLEKSEGAMSKWIAGIWFAALVVSIGTGFSAACILVGSIVHHLVRP